MFPVKLFTLLFSAERITQGLPASEQGCGWMFIVLQTATRPLNAEHDNN